jgi:hypothetical protein
VFTAFFSTAQAPGGSFIDCFIALAEAAERPNGIVTASATASPNTKALAIDIVRMIFPQFLDALILACE